METALFFIFSPAGKPVIQSMLAVLVAPVYTLWGIYGSSFHRGGQRRDVVQ